MKTTARTFTLIATAALVLTTAAGCGTDGTEVEDLELAAADFDCILDWPKVGRYRILNMLGHQDEAEAVGRAAEGGEFPVGTVIQLVPHEAMVKRAPGFSEATRDWEFFLLDVSETGTDILSRGTTEVANDFDTCIGCHDRAEPRFDLVCADGHGCDPLPVTPEQLEMFQNSDPRCM